MKIKKRTTFTIVKISIVDRAHPSLQCFQGGCTPLGRGSRIMKLFILADSNFLGETLKNELSGNTNRSIPKDQTILEHDIVVIESEDPDINLNSIINMIKGSTNEKSALISFEGCLEKQGIIEIGNIAHKSIKLNLSSGNHSVVKDKKLKFVRSNGEIAKSLLKTLHK